MAGTRTRRRTRSAESRRADPGHGHAVARGRSAGGRQPRKTLCRRSAAQSAHHGRQSAKDIRHVELTLEGSGLSYEPGDAMGVWPRNPPAVVEAVLHTLRLDGKHAVSHNGETLALAAWLGGEARTDASAASFVALHAGQARSAELNRLLAPDRAPQLAELLTSHQLLDLLRAYPAEWSAEEFVAALRPLVPRLYSIASSQKVVGAEAHLTVAHRCLQCIRHRTLGCGFAPSCRARRRRPRSDLHRVQRTLPPAGRRRARHHHDRPRHGCRTVPWFPAGSGSYRRHRAQLVAVRQPALQ